MGRNMGHLVWLLLSLPTAFCTPCTLNSVAYQATTPLDTGMDAAQLVAALECAPGYTGSPVYKSYTPIGMTGSDCTFTIPLDGCGICGIYSQGGYLMHDTSLGPPRDAMQFSYLENEVVDTSKYKCHDTTYAARGAYGGLVQAAFAPVCRKDSTTGKPYFQGKLVGCLPLCVSPDQPSALFPGTTVVLSTASPDPNTLKKGSSFNFGVMTYQCQVGWVMGTPPTATTLYGKCGFNRDFEWELFSDASMTVRVGSWCSHPNGTDSFVDRGLGQGYAKRGKASCGLYVPPDGYIFTSPSPVLTIEVPHTHVHKASEFSCDANNDGSVVGDVTCVNGEWEGRIVGCVPMATKCPEDDPWQRLIPRGLYNTQISGVQITPMSCTTEAVLVDNTKPLEGLIECVGGVWTLLTTFWGCRATSCGTGAFSEQFPGYQLSWTAGTVYNGDTLATAALTGLQLLCASQTFVAGSATTSLSDILCTDGHWQITTPSRAPEGCVLEAPSSITGSCHIANVPKLPAGYEFVFDTTSGLVINLRCAEGWYGDPGMFTTYCTPGWVANPTFSGCVPIECDGLKIVCHGACRDPPGKHCERLSGTSACCRDVADEDVMLTILRPRAADIGTASGYGTAMTFSSEDGFLVARPGGGANDDFVMAYQLGTRYSTVSLDSAAFTLPVPSSPAQAANQFKTVGSDGEWVVASTSGTAQPTVPVIVYQYGAVSAHTVTHPDGDTTAFSGFVFGQVTAISQGRIAVLGSHPSTVLTAQPWGDTRPLGLAVYEWNALSSQFEVVSYWESPVEAVAYWPNGQTVLDHTASLSFDYPYVVLGDPTHTEDTGAAGYAQGQVYVWDVREAVNRVLPAPTPLIDWNVMGLVNSPNLKAGTAVAFDFPYLAISVPGMPSCVRGVLDGGQGPKYRSHLYDLSPYNCPGSGAVVVMRYVERFNLAASWQNIEAVLLPPSNAGSWGTYASPTHTSSIKMGNSRHQLAISAKNGGALFVVANVASAAGLRHGSAVGPMVPGETRATVLCYRKYRPNPLATGAAGLVTKWVQTATIGYDEIRSGTNDISAPGVDMTNPQDGGFGASLATYDGTQLIIGAPTLKFDAVGAVGVSYDGLSATVDVTGTVTDAAVGAGFYYHPLILPRRPCGPVPMSSYDGVIPSSSYGAGGRTYDNPCRDGAPDGTVCDAHEGGFTCDGSRGYCGGAFGALVCEDGVWLGTVKCNQCTCDVAPTITSEHSFQAPCDSVEWGKPCIVRCKPGLCGQPQNGVFWCLKTEANPRDTSQLRGAYHSTGALGGCEPCGVNTFAIPPPAGGGFPIANTLIQEGHINAGGANVWRVSCDWSSTVTRMCPADAPSTAWVGNVPDWTMPGACTDCSACAAVLFDTAAEPHANEFTTTPGDVAPYGLQEYTCDGGAGAGFCPNGVSDTSGLAVCKPDASFTSVAVEVYELPTHCRKCFMCDFTRLASMYPNWLFRLTTETPAPNEVGHKVAVHPFACNPAYMGTYTSPVVATDDDIECEDGEWIPPSVPLTQCPPTP